MAWTTFFTLPLLTGWLFKLVFDALATSRSINGLLLLIGLSEMAAWVVFAFAIYVVVRWWVSGLTQLRTNMLHAQTVSGGPRSATLPHSPAEAITRFQDDARDALIWPDSWLDGFATLSYGAGALIIMAIINPAAALMMLIPLVVVTFITRLLRPLAYRAREADREAGGAVTSFLGETFAGLLAFRLAGREDAAVHRLERHTAIRRKTAVRDAVLQETIYAMSSSTSDIAIGLALLALVPAVRSGDFSVGDMALFVTYAMHLGELPKFAARLITAHEQSIVAYRRLGELVAPGRLDDLLDNCEVTIEPRDIMRVREPDPERVPLERLEVRGVTAVYPSTNGGVRDVDLTIEQGSFTVITGPVGSGKSTLLRALAGLMTLDAGTITWNGKQIDDPAAWFVPPAAAHLAQVPRLFSESIASNISLGRDPQGLAEVLELTTLSDDLADMPDGVETMVGARGLRLSGGQAQRVATARSLFTQPELLLVDDLSSALDVTTERQLWQQLRSQGTSTVVAVSHRQLAIDQADQVITLDAGRIVSQVL